MITKQFLKAFPLIAALLLLSCDAENATERSEAKSELSADEARAIAKEAFIYGFPMVVNYTTRRRPTTRVISMCWVARRGFLHPPTGLS